MEGGSFVGGGAIPVTAAAVTAAPSRPTAALSSRLQQRPVLLDGKITWDPTGPSTDVSGISVS